MLVSLGAECGRGVDGMLGVIDEVVEVQESFFFFLMLMRRWGGAAGDRCRLRFGCISGAICRYCRLQL